MLQKSEFLGRVQVVHERRDTSSMSTTPAARTLLPALEWLNKLPLG